MEEYAKHVPRILTRQILKRVIEDYINSIETKDDTPTTESQDVNSDSNKSKSSLMASTKCSIARFYGSLLFVDISGFTKLSQRLNVDELRQNINAYFKKILDIVFRYKGDVVKFAGDALFIIWQTDVVDTECKAFTSAQRKVVQAAVACGAEINETCSNYPVYLHTKSAASENALTSLLSNTNQAGGAAGDIISPSSGHGQSHNFNDEEEVTYLNVHSGVSHGIFAGIDVEEDNRSEYLIVGSAMNGVAEAESQADQGELVICPDTHKILHENVIVTTELHPIKESSDRNDGLEKLQKVLSPTVLSCGCVVTPNGFYCVANPNHINEEVLERRRQESTAEEIAKEAESEYAQDIELFSILNDDITKAFAVVKPTLLEQYGEDLKKSIDVHHAALNDSRKGVSVSVVDPVANNVEDGLVSSEVDEVLFEIFTKWAQDCLTNEYLKHVHEACRGDAKPIGNAYGSLLKQSVEQVILTNNGFTQEIDEASKESSATSGVSPRAPSNHIKRSSIAADNAKKQSSHQSFVDKVRSKANRGSLRLNTKTRHEKLLQDDQSLNAELRSVIVLFISVEMKFNTLLMESITGEREICIDAKLSQNYNFLVRKPSEVLSDEQMLQGFQQCMAIITKILHGNGGQLRQFIVDDKGTVSIGTFGLRGSSNNDNAAAAIEAAMLIIAQLKAMGYRSSIGVTSGKAYCGLVGSKARHEYAVMGPSTNLSARLMGKADPYEMICDVETRKRDRTHNFEKLSEVNAKGYANPVPTFTPVVDEEAIDQPTALESITPRHSNNNYATGKKRPTRGSVVVDTAKLTLHGRENDMFKALSFLLPRVDYEKLEALPITKVYQGTFNTEKQCVFHCGIEAPSRLLMVTGPHGIGKSFFLGACYSRISKLATETNISIFRTKSCIFNMAELFSSWRPLYIQAINHVSQLPKNPFTGEMKNINYSAGIEFLMSKTSPEIQQLKPLLTDIKFTKQTFETNDIVKGLSGAQKINKIIELLSAIFDSYIRITENVMVLVLDNLHAMDSASLQLLKALWSGNNGILMVGGYRDDLAKKVSKSENIMDVLAEFSGSERYSVVPLKDIDYRAVCGLATDIFVAKEVPNVEESIYGRIFLMSGGNPLYAYELTTALTDKYHNELASGAVNILATLLTQFNSDRIEEVITYRFDQLESTLQLAIKMATVASSNGATFTVDMISYMMYEDRYVSSSVMTTEDTQKKLQETKDVAELLLTAVNRHEFIRVSDRRFISPLSSGMASVSGSFSFGENFQTKSEEQELSLENIFDASFEFINELERVCIYDLMLDDQKESLHDRVASYLERDSTRGIGEATAADKYEEAHHWEMAKAWSSAMSCYYKSAMLLNDFGAYTDSFQHLSLAYRMLIAMRRDAGVEDNTDILPASFNDLFNRQPIESKSVPDLHVSQDHNSEKAKTGVPLARSMSVGIPKSQSRLSKLDIYRVFGGDSGLLETGLNVLLRLGQASFTLNENPIIASKLYEEALQLITITWSNSSVLAKNRISTPKTHKLYMKENSSDRIDGQDSTMFGLKDPTICFPILAGVAALYRNGKLKDDNKRSKEAAICQLFTTLAESSTEDIYQMHRLQGLSITTALYLELGRIDDAKVIADTIKASYDYQKFSSKLVDAYGNDRVPYTVAIVLQDLKMKGDLPTSMDYIDFLLNLGPKMSHLHSLGILAYPLCSVLIQVGYTSEAEDLFASYVNMEESRGGFSFFRPVNPLVMESLRLMNCYKNNTVDCRRKLENNIETSTQLLTKVRGKEYIFDNHQRPLVYQVVDSFGFAAEFLCAELLFYHSKYVLSHGQENIESTEDKCSENESDIFKNEVIDDLKLSLEYLEEALQYHEDVVRYRYSHYNCLLLKAEVLTLLSEFAASDAVEMSSGEIKNQAKEILISLHDMVKDFNFFQVRLKTGLYLVRLQLDEELGASIIKRTLADVLEAVGEKLFLGRFEFIKKLFPIVLNYESEIMCEKLKEASQSDQ